MTPDSISPSGADSLNKVLFSDIVKALSKYLDSKLWEYIWDETFYGEEFHREMTHSAFSNSIYANNLVKLLDFRYPYTKSGEISLICYLETAGSHLGQYATDTFGQLNERIKAEFHKRQRVESLDESTDKKLSDESELEFHSKDKVEKDPKSFEQQKLLKILTNNTILPKERAEAGKQLALLGDPRLEVIDVDAIQFCWVAPGRFWMGASTENKEYKSDTDEEPGDWYDLKEGFWISKYPISNAQFESFVNDGGYTNSKWWEIADNNGQWNKKGLVLDSESEPRKHPKIYEGIQKFANHPVVGVTWYEAKAFTEWLNKRFHKTLSLYNYHVNLPNEAEWEKAARGGDFIVDKYVIRNKEEGFTVPNDILRVPNSNATRYFPYASVHDPNKANISQSDIESTTALGCFPEGVSPYGCEDMSGNVREWCRNLYAPSYPFNAKFDEPSPYAEDCALRGGTYIHDYDLARCNARDKASPIIHRKHTGFRIVLIPKKV